MPLFVTAHHGMSPNISNSPDIEHSCCLPVGEGRRLRSLGNVTTTSFMAAVEEIPRFVPRLLSDLRAETLSHRVVVGEMDAGKQSRLTGLGGRCGEGGVGQGRGRWG